MAHCCYCGDLTCNVERGWLAQGSRQVNAYLHGFSFSTSIVLYDRLLAQQRLSPMSSVYSNSEVLAIVSHEIGHWAHSHIPKLFVFHQVCRSPIAVSCTALQVGQGSVCEVSPPPCRCAGGCVVGCRICNREVACSNLGRGYLAPRSTQPSIPRGSVNEYQLRLGRQRQVWLIPFADERVGVHVKL